MIETKDWTKICADCKEGYPPEDCEYYGEPRGCNAPTYGGPPPRYYEELREENARLRAALKIAEDALGESKVSVCHTCNSKCYFGDNIRAAIVLLHDGSVHGYRDRQHDCALCN